MSFENNNNIENQKIDLSKKQEQIDKAFDDILKEYQNMSAEEQAEFISNIAEKDPHFKELYSQLKSFFQDRVMNLEDYDTHLKLEAVKKYIEATPLDSSKNESITLEPNIKDLETLKAIFYRIAPDGELRSKYFTIANAENTKLATIKEEFSAWIERARNYIDTKYSSVENTDNIPETQKKENNEKQSENTTEISESFEVETNKTNSLIESWKTFFEKNKDFWEFNYAITEKEINWNKVSVLSDDVYAWYLRYTDNKEPLIKALWSSEINKAKQELEDSKKAIATSMQYAPENMDRAYNYSYNQYEDKVEKIIEKYTPIAEKFNELLKTDAWKMLISNTAFSSFETKLKNDINSNLWYEENTETEIWTTLENNTKTLLWNINKISNDLAKEIQEFQSNQEYLKQNDYITWERILYQDIPNKYEALLNNQIKDYAFNIWENLISAKSSVISEWKIFNLPIWNWENVKLDFSSLKGVNLDNKNEALQTFRDNFDTIYRNSIWEKISDVFSDIWKSIKENPKKTAVDIWSIVISWLWAVLVSSETWPFAIPVAWITFTTLDNGIRAWAYEAFDIKGWYKAWLWIEESDTHQDILRKKLFELWWNTALFWLFKLTWWLEAKYLTNLEWQLKSLTLKTPVEATFFTYYSVVSENLQNTVKNDWNLAELQNDFSEIPNFDALLKSYVYNLWFITAVKTGAIPAERLVIAWYQKQLNKELEILKSQNIVIVNTWNEIAFYKWNNKLEWADLKGFERFVALNQKVNYIAMEQYRKPESWRWWKSAYSTSFREEKFRKLEEYSKEAQSGKIDYALNDKTIWDTLTSSWIQGWKWVWEWLLKKSWFDKEEIRDYKEWKLKWEKPFEKNAVKEMEKANKIIYKEFLDLKHELRNWVKKWLWINEILNRFSLNKIYKLNQIIEKE